MLKKIFVALFLLYKVTSVFGAENISDSSAKINPNASLTRQVNFKVNLAVENRKRYVMTKVLEKYGSPLKDVVGSFMDTCTHYNLNCYLLPSIAGLESGFGQFTYPGSHNPFGWGGGYIIFDNWDKAIRTVGEGLARNYIGQGALTVDQIGPIYAESPTWAIRVKGFMNEFEFEEQKLALTF